MELSGEKYRKSEREGRLVQRKFEVVLEDSRKGTRQDAVRETAWRRPGDEPGGRSQRCSHARDLAQLSLRPQWEATSGDLDPRVSEGLRHLVAAERISLSDRTPRRELGRVQDCRCGRRREPLSGSGVRPISPSGEQRTLAHARVTQTKRSMCA